MSKGIRFTNREMQYISLFESITGATSVDPKDKGIAIGKNGRNAERIRFLAKRYFDISNVSIL